MAVTLLGVGFFVGSRSDSQPQAVERLAEGPRSKAKARMIAAAGLEQPNILIVLWDTVRADRLSVYGNSRSTTPFIERLGKTSMVFERAISPAMWTVPSHGSLFTGLAVSEHGATFKHRQLDRKYETMAERFAEAGYQTYAFSANPNLNHRSIGLLQGFETVDQSWSKELGPIASEITSKKLIESDLSTEISPGRRGSAGREEVFFNAAPVARKTFRRWLKDRDASKPFLAYINMMEAHKPRVPTMRSRETVIDDPALIALGLETPVTEREHLKYMVELRDYSAKEREAIAGVYDASLRELDMATHGILEDLRVRNLLDNTIVVLVSDHGEALGEHGLFAHKYGLYDELVRVPLLIRYPSKVAAGRRASTVSTQHLYATLLDLTGVPRPRYLKGPSLVDRSTDTPAFAEIASTNSAKYSELLERFPEAEPKVKPLLREAKLVERDGYKLIVYENGERELYNIGVDPNELTNIADDHRDRVEDLLRELVLWEQGHRKRGREQDEREELIAPEGDEEKLLQLLGYVE